MKLFLISQKENNDYDTYDSAVVAAENEEIAKEMNPHNGLPMFWGEKDFHLGVEVLAWNL